MALRLCVFRDGTYRRSVFNDAQIAQLLCTEIIISIKQAIKFNRNKCAVECECFRLVGEL